MIGSVLGLVVAAAAANLTVVRVRWFGGADRDEVRRAGAAPAGGRRSAVPHDAVDRRWRVRAAAPVRSAAHAPGCRLSVAAGAARSLGCVVAQRDRVRMRRTDGRVRGSAVPAEPVAGQQRLGQQQRAAPRLPRQPLRAAAREQALHALQPVGRAQAVHQRLGGAHPPERLDQLQGLIDPR